MLTINHLTITHQKDLQTLIDDLSIVVNGGDKLALIGEEGTGKSTLIKAIYDTGLIADYCQQEGSITNHFNRMGYLPQNMTSSDLDRDLNDYLYHNIDYDSFDFNLFYKIAEQFGFDSFKFDDSQQTVRSLSGGEKIKLQLLKLLANDPDLLLFDEPSSDLDLESLEWLGSFIERTDKTVIFISHDEALLTRAASAILHLELVKKRQQARASYFQGNYEEYKTNRSNRFEKQLQIANKEREEHAKKMDKHHRIHQSVEHVLRNTHDSTAGRLLAKRMKVVLGQEKRLEKEAENFTEIPQDMDAIQIFFSDIKPLPASKLLLSWENKVLDTGQKVDLLVRGQDKMVITGKNGIGKTGLLNHIFSELSAKQGLSVGYMPQNYGDQLDMSQSALHFLQDSASQEKIRSLLASLQFTRQEINHPVSELSGGQKAKLFLAKMVLEGNNVLILDEPTRHFSPTSQPLLRQMLQDFTGAIISVSHDRKYIEEVPALRYHLIDKSLINID